MILLPDWVDGITSTFMRNVSSVTSSHQWSYGHLSEKDREESVEEDEERTNHILRTFPRLLMEYEVQNPFLLIDNWNLY